MPLTDTACRNAKATNSPLKLSDGGGLFLLVQPNGSKLWRLAYRYAGKQKLISFGAYPAVPLSDARAGRDQAKRQHTAHIADVARSARRDLGKSATASFPASPRRWPINGAIYCHATTSGTPLKRHIGRA